jgi:AhpD family alkylhydroperoxidase
MIEKDIKKLDKDKILMFREERERLNQLVMKYAGINTKRFHKIDDQVYKEGALSSKTKELMGLVSSLVLRCDDCILYHLISCREEGVTDTELEETLAVGLIVGGSITIPHIRRVWECWDKMKQSDNLKEDKK